MNHELVGLARRAYDSVEVFSDLVLLPLRPLAHDDLTEVVTKYMA